MKTLTAPYIEKALRPVPPIRVFLVQALALGWFGFIAVVIFYVFLSFGGCLGHVRTSLERKGGFWSPLRGQMRGRVVFGVLGRRILRPRVAQETPRVANNDEKTAQRGLRGIPKEGKIAKPRKLQHLDFERPYEGLATFTPFGETGRRKKTAEI